jgi:hypothetical protein
VEQKSVRDTFDPSLWNADFRVACFCCKQLGHYAADCPYVKLSKGTERGKMTISMKDRMIAESLQKIPVPINTRPGEGDGGPPSRHNREFLGYPSALKLIGNQPASGVGDLDISLVNVHLIVCLSLQETVVYFGLALREWAGKDEREGGLARVRESRIEKE